MTRELYQLLLRTKELCEEANKQLKDYAIEFKFDLPPIYYKNLGKICFIEFLLENERLEDENIK